MCFFCTFNKIIFLLFQQTIIRRCETHLWNMKEDEEDIGGISRKPPTQKNKKKFP
jgi:hypothetical protein